MKEDPDKGKQALAQEMCVAISTIKLAINGNFRYESYKRCKGLTEKILENSPTNAKKHLNKVEQPVEQGTISFFSDKNNFCQDKLHNIQNNRCLQSI